MMKLTTGAMASAILILTGCGGGSGSSEVKTGLLIDSPVAGVSYATVTETGVTNTAGEFTYRSGEQITFSIGALSFPAVTAIARITPATLGGGNTTTATNIARLLQSMDTDANPANGITISDTAAANASGIDFSLSATEFENNAAVVNLVANSGSSTTSLVSSEAALAHLASSGIQLTENTPGSITVVSWGGAYTNSQVEAYHKPWIASTGNQITSVDYNGGLSEIRSQVASGNVTWDVVDVELPDAKIACNEGLLEPIDATTLPPAPDNTPATADFINGTLHECAVANIVWSTVIGYNTNTIGTAPNSIADFFDTTNFPGKRGVRRNPKSILEMALLADGVANSQVYSILATDAGIDRALAKLDTIKNDIVWWEAGAQSVEFLADPEVTMTTTYNGRLFNQAILDNQPYATMWDGQIWDVDLWVVPKGTSNKSLAMDFVRFSTATEQLAAQASYISYGPARQSSFALIGNHYETGVDMKPQVPTAPQNFQNALQSDGDFWLANQESLSARFNTWINE